MRQRLLLLGRELGDARLGLATLQSLGAERLGPPTGRVAELTLQEADDRVGDVVLRGVLLEVRRVGLGAHQGEGKVPDDLGGGGDLDQVAQDPVGRGIHVLDRLEAVAEPERDGLLAQIGQLTTGDLVRVDPTRGRGQPGLERGVQRAHRLPVRLEREDVVDVQAGFAGGPVRRGHQGRQRRL